MRELKATRGLVGCLGESYLHLAPLCIDMDKAIISVVMVYV